MIRLLCWNLRSKRNSRSDRSSPPLVSAKTIGCNASCVSLRCSAAAVGASQELAGTVSGKESPLSVRAARAGARSDLRKTDNKELEQIYLQLFLFFIDHL